MKGGPFIAPFENWLCPGVILYNRYLVQFINKNNIYDRCISYNNPSTNQSNSIHPVENLQCFDRCIKYFKTTCMYVFLSCCTICICSSLTVIATKELQQSNMHAFCARTQWITCFGVPFLFHSKTDWFNRNFWTEELIAPRIVMWNARQRPDIS